MAFNIPKEIANEDVNTGCPPGYVKVGDACVNPLTEFILEISEASEYGFHYYEHAGELVGKYDFKVVGNPPTPSAYFGQNLKMDRITNINPTKPSQVISKDEAVLYQDILHKIDGEVEILQDVYADDPDYNSTFVMGEFHLLPNNLGSIKRINLNVDIVDQDGNTFYDLANRINQNIVSMPSNREGDVNNLVKFYLGYVRLPSFDRPDEMIQSEGNDVSPTIKNPLYATNRLKWKSLRETCFRWIEIYDDMSLMEYFGGKLPKNGHYLCQIKCVVNAAKIKALFDSSIDLSGYTEDRRYKLLFYPPSFYAFPCDVIDEVDSPRINALNNFMEEIIFTVPQNYKSDGNVHYIIEFLTAKNSGDILFRTSSYLGYEWSENYHWFESSDGETWETITPSMPTFNNSFLVECGTDSENTKYIKYELSEEARSLTRDRADILFRIKQIDGTLIA